MHQIMLIFLKQEVQEVDFVFYHVYICMNFIFQLSINFQSVFHYDLYFLCFQTIFHYDLYFLCVIHLHIYDSYSIGMHRLKV